MAFIACPCLNIQIRVAQPITGPISKEGLTIQLVNSHSIQKAFPSLITDSLSLSLPLSTASDSVPQREDESDANGQRWRRYECLHCNSGPIYSSTTTISRSAAISHQPQTIIVHENAVLYSSIQDAIKQTPNYLKILNIAVNCVDNVTIRPIPNSVKNIPAYLRPFYKEIKQKLDQTLKRLRLESKVRIEMLKGNDSLSKSQAKAIYEATEKSVKRTIAEYNKMWSLAVPKLEETAKARLGTGVNADNNAAKDEGREDDDEETMFFLDEEVLSDNNDVGVNAAIDKKKLDGLLPEMDHKFSRWIRKRQARYSQDLTDDDDESEDRKEDFQDADEFILGHGILPAEKEKVESDIDELAISKFATSVPITINYYRASMEEGQAFSALDEAT